ncbi:Protein FAM13A [Papilio machaon]|uniref:Protein FAM13A n=1 Tax=Papilio machaon TaxID=76193 RepID=A0A0N0PBD2_PAPMA|nr:Protein FAM13A [Papilio machaon]
MILLEVTQGYGHSTECSSERRVVISETGWRAQCEREREKTEDMAAPECEREARKRRERRDSGCAHERKERRPHSEERAQPQPPLAPLPPPPPLHDHNRIESERRAERLSRARRPQLGGKRRRPPARIPRQPKENEIFHDDVRCDIPPHYECLVQKPELGPELEQLENVGRHEEVEHARRDERSVAPRRVQPTADRRLDKINKKISVLKKNIAKYENEYEVQNGRAITPSDRITDVHLTRMHETLRKLQAEKRCIKTDPIEYALKAKAAKQQKERDAKLDAALNSDKPMTELVRDIEEEAEECKMFSNGRHYDVALQDTADIEGSSLGSACADKWLQGCREMDGRSSVAEARWSGAQLSAEKLCVQRALLRLEAARGRPPVHSADRGAARHLYERYRAVKRALAATRNDTIIGTNGELATIHEHEAIVFSSSLDSSSDSQERATDSSQDTAEAIVNLQPLRRREVREGVEVVEGGEASSAGEELPSSSSAQSAASDEQANAGLHFLGLDDLTRALAEAKLHKCVLRRGIKEYEVNFEQQHSRKLQKDDKKGNEEEYIRYKAIKARIKLLNALINKQKSKA